MMHHFSYLILQIQVEELQKKVLELSKSLEDYKNQAEAAKKVADQARIDCQNQMKLMEDVCC